MELLGLVQPICLIGAALGLGTGTIFGVIGALQPGRLVVIRSKSYRLGSISAGGMVSGLGTMILCLLVVKLAFHLANPGVPQ